jgi:ribosomal protein S13
MKNVISSLIFVAILFAGLNGSSQNAKRYPYIKERIARAKLNEIQLKFKLDAATFDHFRPIYMKYEEEISGIDFRKMAKLMKVDPDSLSASDAELLIKDQLESAKKIISLREKYYKEFRTVLSPQQILKLYQIEADLRKEITQEIKSRRANR